MHEEKEAVARDVVGLAAEACELCCVLSLCVERWRSEGGAASSEVERVRQLVAAADLQLVACRLQVQGQTRHARNATHLVQPK